MQSVGTKPSLETWTGTIRTKNGELPDLKAWTLGFRESVGDAFALRGVEVTVEGTLVAEDGGHLALRLSGSGPALRLKPLCRKIQWEPKRDREQPATEEERNAYRTLTEAEKASPGQNARVRITGPLEESPEGGPPVLSVRLFARDCAGRPLLNLSTARPWPSARLSGRRD